MRINLILRHQKKNMNFILDQIWTHVVCFYSFELITISYKSGKQLVPSYCSVNFVENVEKYNSLNDYTDSYNCFFVCKNTFKICALHSATTTTYSYKIAFTNGAGRRVNLIETIDFVIIWITYSCVLYWLHTIDICISY